MFVVPSVKWVWDKWILFEEKKKNNLFELYCKRENDNFFAFILFFEMLGMVLGSSGMVLIHKYTPISHIAEVYSLKPEVLHGFIFFLISIGWSILLTRMVWVRKRTLADKIGKKIIVLSIIILHISSFSAICGDKLANIYLISILIYIILEIVGLLHFQGRYVEYQFSKLRIYLETGEEIICENIEKVKRRRNLVIIEKDDRTIILKYDTIMKVEYYGGPKIITNEKMKSPILRLGKKVMRNKYTRQISRKCE